MTILGISCYFHDSAATIIHDGKIIAAAAEERFTRKKHDNSFPINAINFCIKQAGIAANELDGIVFYEKPLIKFERIFHQHLDNFPKNYNQFIKTIGPWFSIKLSLKEVLKKELNYFGKIYYVEHHLSHAASAYYIAPFDNATIVTIDGVGEWATTTIGTGVKGKIKIDKQINFPHSLGLVYSAITTYLGFDANDSEYKVMGLAAYGNPNPYKRKFDKLINTFADGSFAINMDYFDYDWSETMYSKKLIKLLGHPPRKQDEPVQKHHENIAAALQEKLEETVFSIFNYVQKKYGKSNLCFSGGVALNSVLNGKIASNTKFKHIFIPPDPSDAGASMGAAIYLYQKITGKRVEKENFTPYLGPDYKWYQIESEIKKFKLKYELVPNDTNLCKKVAKLIEQENVIGWFQGKMEWGPRALGNRSILASARTEEMRDKINAKVKKREMFRPFAPVILEEDTQKYFLTDKYLSPSARWMLMVYPFKKIGYRDVPAVVHVDKTGRLETLIRKDNQKYYDLVNEYKKLTNVPIIINTSFNVKGEPIVCSPKDAINCFLKTDIDYLVIENYIIKK